MWEYVVMVNDTNTMTINGTEKQIAWASKILANELGKDLTSIIFKKRRASYAAEQAWRATFNAPHGFRGPDENRDAFYAELAQVAVEEMNSDAKINASWIIENRDNLFAAFIAEIPQIDEIAVKHGFTK